MRTGQPNSATSVSRSSSTTHSPTDCDHQVVTAVHFDIRIQFSSTISPERFIRIYGRLGGCASRCVAFLDIPAKRKAYTRFSIQLITLRKPYDHRQSDRAVVRSVIEYDVPTRDQKSFSDMPHGDVVWPIFEACWARKNEDRWPAERIASHLREAIATR